MKVGINSYAYRWAICHGEMDVVSFLEKAVELGVDVVQICDNLPFDALSDEECDRIRARFGKQVSIKTGYKGLVPANLERALNVSKRLGATSMRLVIDDNGCKATTDEVVSVMSSMLPLLEKLDIRISIENHFKHTPEELKEILERVGSKYLTICYDCFNSISLNIGTEQSFSVLLPYIEDVHVKDVKISRFKTGFLFSGCRFGEGILDVKDIVSRTLAIHPDASFILEGWIDEAGGLSETIKNEQEINKDGIRYLKELWK